jgi:hypothetical protein
MAAAIIALNLSAYPARNRLAAIRNVSIFDRPLGYNKDGCVAFILCSIRSYEIRTDGESYRALFYLRDNVWLTLAENVDENTAYAAVVAHIHAVAGVPWHYSAENDAAERAAAAEVFAAFSAPLPRPAVA